jgi:hypothetical protein
LLHTRIHSCYFHSKPTFTPSNSFSYFHPCNNLLFLGIRMILLLLLVAPFWAVGQSANLFSTITLRVDSSVYDYERHSVNYLGEPYFYFEYREEQPTVEFRFYSASPIEKLELKYSSDYKVIDSLQYLGAYYRLKVQFNQLADTRLLAINFSAMNAGSTQYFSLPLLAYREPLVSFKPLNTDLYIGEEKVFDLLCSDPQNIFMDNQWVRTEGIEYRLSRED